MSDTIVKEGWHQHRSFLVRKYDEGQSDGAIEELSPRELEVWKLMAQGLSNCEIAKELGIAKGTVSTHLYIVFGKLGARNRVRAIMIGTDAGLHLPDSGEAQAPKPQIKKIVPAADDSALDTRNNTLTDRQLDVARLIAKGYDNTQIARELNVSEKTVRSRVSVILSKWNCTSRTQVALITIGVGLITKFESSGLPKPRNANEAIRWAQHYLEEANRLTAGRAKRGNA